jgi:hypothetical protein
VTINHGSTVDEDIAAALGLVRFAILAQTSTAESVHDLWCHGVVSTVVGRSAEEERRIDVICDMTDDATPTDNTAFWSGAACEPDVPTNQR